MESNNRIINKRSKGALSKAKLVLSFYHLATKQQPSKTNNNNNNNNPCCEAGNNTESSNTTTHHHHHRHVNKPAKLAYNSVVTQPVSVGYKIIVNKDLLLQQNNPILPPSSSVDHHSIRSSGKMENFLGAVVEDDEAVDAKAAKYISAVQERFRLDERLNSERTQDNMIDHATLATRS